MDDLAQWLFQVEILKQTEIALLAAGQIENALVSVTSGESNAQTRFWASVQAFLVAVALVSRLLWPSKRTEVIPERGEELRKILGVPDNSPLRSRRFRDHFEHFDERLEQWIATSRTHFYTDGNIRDSRWRSDSEEATHFRNFEKDGFAVLYGAERYELRPIIDALKQLFGQGHSNVYKTFQSHKHEWGPSKN